MSESEKVQRVTVTIVGVPEKQKYLIMLSSDDRYTILPFMYPTLELAKCDGENLLNALIDQGFREVNEPESYSLFDKSDTAYDVEKGGKSA
jgi:hypothetical protein